jgi:hypothetical protein
LYFLGIGRRGDRRDEEQGKDTATWESLHRTCLSDKAAGRQATKSEGVT